MVECQKLGDGHVLASNHHRGHLSGVCVPSSLHLAFLTVMWYRWIVSCPLVWMWAWIVGYLFMRWQCDELVTCERWALAVAQLQLTMGYGHSGRCKSTNSFENRNLLRRDIITWVTIMHPSVHKSILSSSWGVPDLYVMWPYQEDGSRETPKGNAQEDFQPDAWTTSAGSSSRALSTRITDNPWLWAEKHALDTFHRSFLRVVKCLYPIKVLMNSSYVANTVFENLGKLNQQPSNISRTILPKGQRNITSLLLLLFFHCVCFRWSDPVQRSTE